MSSQKANPRRAARRLLIAARHRALMADLFGQCMIVGGRRVQMAHRTTLTADEAAQLSAALDEVYAAVERAEAAGAA